MLLVSREGGKMAWKSGTLLEFSYRKGWEGRGKGETMNQGQFLVKCEYAPVLLTLGEDTIVVIYRTMKMGFL